MHAANDCTPHDPSGQDSLSLQIKQCAGNPAALTALLRQLCPGPYFIQPFNTGV